jgi:flagellar motor switch protein FliG
MEKERCSLSDTILEKPSGQELTEILNRTHPRVVLSVVSEAEDADLAIFLLTLEHASADLAKHAAQILSQLPPEKQLSVAEKIAETEIVDSERVKEIYGRLVEQILTAANRTTVFGDGASNLAKLLSHMPLDNQNRLLESLEQKQPNLANAINEQIFTFDDIVNLNDDAMQTVLQTLDPSTIALALHKTSPELQEAFLRNMSPESALTVEREMENLTFEQTQIADTARQSIVSMIRRFAVKGMIRLEEK